MSLEDVIGTNLSGPPQNESSIWIHENDTMKRVVGNYTSFAMFVRVGSKDPANEEWRMMRSKKASRSCCT